MDRLYVSYEKYRRMIAEKKILHRLVQGVRILTVALACYCLLYTSDAADEH